MRLMLNTLSAAAFLLILTVVSLAQTALGETRLPALYIIGDSTVKNGTRGQMGWGDPLSNWFDSKRIRVVNRARGGRSSRTFRTEGLWDQVLSELRPGDFVLMQFGHNDGGSLAKSTRASLKGSGEETEEVRDDKTGKVETVHTFGWYIRHYAAEARMKGATPIVCSLIPRNIWSSDHTVARGSGDYGKWALEAAQAEQVPFIDLNERIARKYEALGEEKVKSAFFPTDHTHTNAAGAELNAATVVEGIRALKLCPLSAYLLEKPTSAPVAASPGGLH